MEKLRITLTDEEIRAVRMAILDDIQDKEKLMKIVYGDDVNPEGFIVKRIGALKSALNKLDAASYGKKGK